MENGNTCITFINPSKQTIHNIYKFELKIKVLIVLKI